MSASARSRPVALVLSLVPGWGHVYWGREAPGLGLFTLFAVAGFALLNGLFIYIGNARSLVVALSSVLLLASIVGSWIDILRATNPGRLKALEAERDKALREGTVAYLRGDLKAAIDLFEGCVRRDPGDVEALFRLGAVCSRSGESRAAQVWLRRARKHDLDEKWAWEVERELERLKKATGAVPAPGESHARKQPERSPA